MSRNLSAFTLSTALFAVLMLSSFSYAQTDFWQQTSGPSGGFVVTLAINSSGDIFAGALGPGVSRSSNNGNTWSQINTGLTSTSVRTLAINDRGDIFAGTREGMFRSSNNGNTWSQINTGLTDSTNVNALAINNSNGDIFAGTFYGVFRSSNNGNTWIHSNTGLTDSILVDALAVNNSNGDIFAGTNGDGVFRSSNNGNTWTQINTGLTNTDVRVFAINSNGDIFAGTDNPGGVFRSSDNGDTWIQISSGLTDTDIQALAINNSGTIFAGTINGGVFRSAEPAVVLIHGYRGSNDSWGSFGELLENRGINVKFFSHSSTDIAIEILSARLNDSLIVWGDELNIEGKGVNLVAHSMGGLISRHYISHYPNNVNKLITLATPQYGTYAGNQASLIPLSFFADNIQTRQQALGSPFIRNLHREWEKYLAITSDPPDILTIVATRDGANRLELPCVPIPPLFILPFYCAYGFLGSDEDPYDDIDGLVAVNSQDLENFGTPVFYVPNTHSGANGVAFINDEMHPSFHPITTFLSGTVPTTPPEDNIGNPGHPIHYSSLGNFLLGLKDPDGNPIEVESVDWPLGIRGNNWGRNNESGLYFASMVQPGSHNIIVGPNVAGFSTISETITIKPHQTNVYEHTVYPADESSSNNFVAGNTNPVSFGNTNVAMDFSSGPGGEVSVYRFDENPPAAEVTTLPHYWDIVTDMPNDSFSVIVTFNYDESEVLNAGLTEENLVVAFFDSIWHSIDTAIDIASNKVSINTTHFSLFSIGTFVPTSVEATEQTRAPTEFRLSQNYPNPF